MGMNSLDRTLIQNFSLLYSHVVYLYGKEPYVSQGAKYLDIAAVPYTIIHEGEELSGGTGADACILIDCRPGLHAEQDYRFLTESCDVVYIFSLMGLVFALKKNIEYEKIPDSNRESYHMEEMIKEQVRQQLSVRFLLEDIDKLAKEENPVLIYQPGKVGSTTLLHSLKKFYSNVHAIHALNPYGRYLHLGEEEALWCKERTELIASKTKKIISIVREPLARDLSAYFEGILCLENDIYIPDRESSPVYDSIEYFRQLCRQEPGWYFDSFSWFDDEIRKVFDIDIYEYPFDREKGYTRIQAKEKDILLLTMEQSGKWEEALQEFFEDDTIRLQDRENTADEKLYASLYREVQNGLEVPGEYMDYYTGNAKVSHFYGAGDSIN